MKTRDKIDQLNMLKGMSRRDVLKTVAGAGAFLLMPSFSFAGKENGMKGELVKRKIYSSGESVPAVGLGTARTFDTNPLGDLDELRQVLEIFYKSGGRVIDTSPMYGHSEEIIGILTEKLGITDKLFTATKVWTTGKENGIEQMNRSMELLKTRPIDLMQVHNLTDTDTHLKTMNEWKKEGKIRYTGVTHYRTDAYPALELVLNNHKIDFIQFNYSIVTREAEEKLLPLAKDKEVAVVINEPFEKGRLFSKVRGKELPEWAKEFDCNSWAQYFLKYIISHPAVTCVIPATSDPKHMKDNIGAVYGKFPDGKMRKKMVEYLENL